MPRRRGFFGALRRAFSNEWQRDHGRTWTRPAPGVGEIRREPPPPPPPAPPIRVEGVGTVVGDLAGGWQKPVSPPPEGSRPGGLPPKPPVRVLVLDGEEAEPFELPDDPRAAERLEAMNAQRRRAHEHITTSFHRALDRLLEELKAERSGAQLIALERLRQINEKGFDSEHDSQLDAYELLDAAYCYLLYVIRGPRYFRGAVPPSWPWDKAAFAPGDKLESLVKAGALIAAEIDRVLSEPPEPIFGDSDVALQLGLSPSEVSLVSELHVGRLHFKRNADGHWRKLEP